MKYILAIFAVPLFCSVACAKNENRLSRNVVPLSYNITLDIDLENACFKGDIQILINVFNATNSTTFHAADLTLHRLQVDDSSHYTVISEKEYFCNTTLETCKFNHTMNKGLYKIIMKYEGKFNMAMKGLFATKYTRYRYDVARTMALTHFQMTNARRVFPCFDEPKFLANFTISIIRDKNNMALSNMPLQYTQALPDGRFLDTFEVATELATYQVAFVVGNFFNDSYSKGSIYTASADSNELHTYVATVSNATIRAMEGFVPQVLPMKKIDIVIVRHIPEPDAGLSSRGLIVLPAEPLLSNIQATKTIEEQNILLTVAHVYLHQFFGNIILVSNMENSSWFIEALVDFCKYWIANHVHPEWELLEQRNLLIIREAVRNDKSLAFPRIFADKHPESITYQKAIMLTLDGIVGSRVFREGVRFFIHKYTGSVPTPEDFWVSLQDSIWFDKKAHVPEIDQTIKRDLVKIMKRWQDQVGVPVLHAFRNYSSFEIKLTQRRLKQIEGAGPEAWDIPINVITKSSPTVRDSKPELIMNSSSTNMHRISDEWFIINSEAAYYYLVNYDDTNWKRLANALNSERLGKIQPVTRGKLLYDAFTLAKYKTLKYDVALELIKYLRRERSYVALNSFFYVFEYFYIKYSGIENFHYFQKFLANSLQPALEDVGFYENKHASHTNPHINNLNRIQLIKWACLLGNEFCRNTTTELLMKWNFDEMSHDLKEAIICAGLIDADEDLWNQYNYAAHQDDSHLYFTYELGCSQNERNLHRYIEDYLTLNISVFDKIYSRGTFGVNFVLDYILKNAIVVRETLSVKVLAHMYTDLTNYISTKEQLKKLKNVFFFLELDTAKLGFSPDEQIRQLSEILEASSLDYNDINQWITKEIINEGNLSARASLFVLIVLVLLNVF